MPLFFSAYLGNDDNLRSWQDTVQRHAAWIGLTTQLESRNLNDGKNFSCAWLKHASSDKDIYLKETGEFLIATTSDAPGQGNVTPNASQSWQRLTEHMDSNVIHIGISMQSGELRVAVPVATPEQFYFARDSRGYVLGNDMRLLMRWAGLDLDPHAVFALFQYGAIPSPFTISKTVRRVPNGHLLRIMPNTNEPVFGILRQADRALREYAPASDPEERLQETLDRILAAVPSPTALYFSGGVDSGLLAARLAELGRTDVRLISYAFGPDDAEANLAMRMAEHLGLVCEQINYDPSEIPSMVDRLGKDYSFPFDDESVMPTNLMVHASLKLLGPPFTAIEGTGADGAFGLMEKYRSWNRMYSLPRAMRWSAAAGYKWLKLWRHRSKIEHIGQAARESMQMPFHHATIIARNPFDGIAYTIPRDVREALENAIRTQIQAMSLGVEPEEELSHLDLVHVCAGRFAAKSFDPLRTNGATAIYPFLEPAMLQLSSSLPGNVKGAGGETKALLKNLLARNVPREFIYRPKSGFSTPVHDLNTAFRIFLSNVAWRESPLIDYCQLSIVEEMIQQVENGQPLSDRAYHFLWAFAFTTIWLSQLEL